MKSLSPNKYYYIANSLNSNSEERKSIINLVYSAPGWLDGMPVIYSSLKHSGMLEKFICVEEGCVEEGSSNGLSPTKGFLSVRN